MDQIYGSWDHNCLLVHDGLVTIGWRRRFGAREVVVIARREMRSLGFSPMTPLGGGAAEMVTQQRSTKVVSGAPMERWFRAR
jgi:hypothetical protein